MRKWPSFSDFWNEYYRTHPVWFSDIPSLVGLSLVAHSHHQFNNVSVLGFYPSHFPVSHNFISDKLPKTFSLVLSWRLQLEIQNIVCIFCLDHPNYIFQNCWKIYPDNFCVMQKQWNKLIEV
jgi:hypothetical protein